MTKTRHKVYDAAGNVKPYVDRAMGDEKLRNDVLSAFATAREVYSELVGSRNAAASPVNVAARVATDDDIREKLRAAVDDLRNAAERLQGRAKKDHSGRNTTLLVTGIALGVLFNPVTGAETRKWLVDLVGGGSSDSGGDYTPPATSNGA